MVITNNNLNRFRNIRIRNRTVERTDSVKFSGLRLDDELSFKNHVSYITNKLSGSVGAINRILYFVPFPQLLNLYYSLVCPYLIYGIVAWSKASSERVARVQRIQHRAFKVITKYDGNHSHKLKLMLNVESIYSHFTLTKLYKISKEHNHEYLHDRLMNIQVDHEHSIKFNT